MANGLPSRLRGMREIYVMNADGRTNAPRPDYGPCHRTEGIAFYSWRDGNMEIYVDADGGSPKNLTNNARSDTNPSWSPDGKRIAFESWRDRNGEIYVMDADGGNPRNLSNHPFKDEEPSWSPDGRRLSSCLIERRMGTLKSQDRGPCSCMVWSCFFRCSAMGTGD